MLILQIFFTVSLYINIITFCGFAFYLVTSLFTFLVNPGIEYCNGKNANKNYCRFCDFYYPSNGKKIEHCAFCQVCVNNLDHHCDVIGKCVGRKNLFWFYAFITACFAEMMIIMGIMTNMINNRIN